MKWEDYRYGGKEKRKTKVCRQEERKQKRRVQYEMTRGKEMKQKTQGDKEWKECSKKREPNNKDIC